MNRFYTNVTVSACDGGFCIFLDTRRLETPSHNLLVIPTQALADAIAGEWAAQSDTINPDTMPLHGLTVTAIDKDDDETRANITQAVTPYIDGDLLFYHAPEPAGLVTAQSECWGAILHTAQDHFGQALRITHDLTAITQSPAYHEVIIHAIASLNIWQFTAFHNLVALTGSPVIAMLAVHRRMTADAIIQAVYLEDDYYAALYGDAEDTRPIDQQQKRHQTISDITACLDFLSLYND